MTSDPQVIDKQYTSEEIAQQISALGDSANVIDEIISKDDQSEEQRDRMDRNVRHIGIMRSKPHLAGIDFVQFISAAERGSAWLAEHQNEQA